jgi:hypothetical protein
MRVVKCLKVGLHGLHFLWLTFIYLIKNQINTSNSPSNSGFTCKPTLGHLKET